MEKYSILSPCGILGYGFPESSFQQGMDMQPDAVVVDAGSTDAGPHKLGAGVSIVSRMAAKKDLQILILNGLSAHIPVIVGSAGGAGAAVHVEWTVDIVKEILRENGLNARVAVICADMDKSMIKRKIEDGEIYSMGTNIPGLTAEILDETNSVVAQMGHEPVVDALNGGADIILCGRSYDPSVFAAPGIWQGFDPGLCYHMGKVLECGALCAEPGTTKDCILGTLYEDHFTVRALNPERRCSVISVAAHTFYEKENPCILHGPGFTLDLSSCRFQQEEENIVAVRGSRFIPNPVYKIKLEGARQVAYRTFVIGAIRDPVLLSRIDEIEEKVRCSVEAYMKEIPRESYRMNFFNYGRDGIMGSREPEEFHGHEMCVVFEVLAQTQELANTVCACMRSTFLHCDYEGRKSTAGNLAFPFAPSDIPFGPVYEFCVYHLMSIPDGRAVFPVTYTDIRNSGA